MKEEFATVYSGFILHVFISYSWQTYTENTGNNVVDFPHYYFNQRKMFLMTPNKPYKIMQ